MTAHAPFLKLERLEKTFADGTRAVKGIDLEVEKGELIVLLGPSGCGKTTTLRMIAGLELPSSGRIELDGESVTRRRPSQRDVGFVFQFYALYPHLTVAQNLAFPLQCTGVAKSEIERRVADVAERLGLTELLARRPRELSGGDQQRVGLGRAMVRRPRVWLMDEPLGTLDADRRLAMCEFLREQQLESKVTTIYVTHDQEEAMRLADRVVVMSEGRIEQVGRPLEVYDDPASLFVAHFVGSPGMNFVRGEVANELARAHGLPLARGATVLGVRPEFVRVADEGPLRGEIIVSEYLGASRCLHVQTSAGTLVARAPADSPARVGAQVALAFDAAHARWFDDVTGARLA